MKPVDSDAGFYIKKVFAEGNIIAEFKINMEFFRFEYELLLKKIGQNGKQENATGDIPDDSRQKKGFGKGR